MIRILLGTLVFLVVLASSCQREYVLEDIDNPIPQDSTQTSDPDSLSSEYGGLLKRTIYYTEGVNDTALANYGYDAQNRLIEYNIHTKKVVNPSEKEYNVLIRITREANGVIKEISLVSRLFETPDDNEPHYDIKYKVYYDENLAQYKYAILTGLRENEYGMDSIVFEYSGSNVTKKTKYSTNSMSIPVIETVHIAYDNKNNIIRHNRFQEYEGNINESYDITYIYDDKVTMGNFGELSFLLDEDITIFRSGENNLLRGTDRLGRYSFPVVAYSYNTFGRPAKSIHSYEDFDEKEIVIYQYSK